MTVTSHSVSRGLSFTDLIVFRHRWWQHLIFWGAAFLILVNIFKTSSSFEKIDLIYTLIFLIPIASIVYVNLYTLIPGVLRKERYLIYVLLFLGLLVASASFLYFLFDRWIDYILPNYYFIAYYSIPQLMLYTGSILILATLLKLSRSWFLLLRMERITASHQLKSLQSQINPHFLLNSLQTIYALSLEKSGQTPEVILQLSEILKYTLYETAHARVKLVKEINMIRDYVEIQRLRVDPQRTNIQLSVEGEPGNSQIAPMLLIPFIENSFKHGLQSDPGHAFVNITFRIRKGTLEFRIENSTGHTGSIDLEEKKGIGIQNTKQRLDLLYPGKHELSIQKSEAIYNVSLKLKLEEE